MTVITPSCNCWASLLSKILAALTITRPECLWTSLFSCHECREKSTTVTLFTLPLSSVCTHLPVFQPHLCHCYAGTSHLSLPLSAEPRAFSTFLWVAQTATNMDNQGRRSPGTATSFPIILETVSTRAENGTCTERSPSGTIRTFRPICSNCEVTQLLLYAIFPVTYSQTQTTHTHTHWYTSQKLTM